MRQPAYEYHPKDAEYIKKHGLRWISYYVSKIVSANKIGCDSFVDGIAEAYRRTGSIRQAGKLMGITERSFSLHARRLGIKLKPPGGPNRRKNGD